MAKNKYDYFDSFSEMVQYSCDAAKMLYNTLEHFNLGELSQKIEDMHKIEHSADLKKHEMMSNLLHEFITPIEREDIVNLADSIDSVTDAIEDVLIRLYIFNIKGLRLESLAFADVILKCCNALKNAVDEMKNYKRSTTIKSLIIEVNRLEEEGDKLYITAVKDLFLNSKDTIEIVSWREAFEHFEKCCDACEDVADIIETVIMKNS